MLWAHAGQLLEHWKSLWMFGCWGLEARHRLIKRFYDLSMKATEVKGSRKLGIGQVLHRCVVRTALKRFPDRSVFRKRAESHANQVVQQAKQHALGLLRGPRFKEAIADLVSQLQSIR